MRALITGATGFVGQELIKRFDQVTVLSRDRDAAARLFPQARVFAWSSLQEPAPAEAFQDVDVVFHLAGEPVASGRWSAAKKDLIKRTRSEGTSNLVKGIEQAATKPKVLVSASAIGIYGSRGDELLDEKSDHGNDFVSEICLGWEGAAAKARDLGLRVVQARIGVVLGKGGGALSKMLLPFRLGLGGKLGNGKHWMSWVHLKDVVDMLVHAATHEEIHGPFNVVAPICVTNAEFTKILAKAVHRPAFFVVPKFMLSLALGEVAEALLLASQRVVPHEAEKSGYNFHFRDLASALAEILG